MPETIAQIQEKRKKLVVDAQRILDTAKAENRSVTAEEDRQYEAIMVDVDKFGAEVDTLRKDDDRRSRLQAVNDDLAKPQGRRTAPISPADANRVLSDRDRKREARRARMSELDFRRGEADYRDGFRSWLCNGERGVTDKAQKKALREVRSLQADADTQAGYLIPSMQYTQKFIKFIDDQVFIRKLATVIPVPDAQSLGAPSWDNDPADSDWTSELLTGSEDTTASVGGRALTPHPLAKSIKVSRKFLRMASWAESYIMDRFRYKFGITEEKAYMTGTGSSQALGVFTASAKGIPTTQDVSTDNTTTAITADGLMNAKYNLKAGYQMSPRTAWIFHRTAVRNIRKLKDGVGQYIWSAGLKGEPDTILDKPFYMSEYAPSTFTTGKYVGIIGEWSNYWIADALTHSIQRVDELYAATNQVGYFMRRELDAMPVLAEAFVRVTLA